MPSNEEKVKTVVSEMLGVPAADIRLDHNLAKDLQADSLDVVEVVMALEDEFGIAIPDEDVETPDISVRELLALVDHYLHKPKS